MSGFEELYLEHCRRVYSICLSILANVAEAEDLTQEIFIQLHRKLGAFRGEAAFYNLASPANGESGADVLPSALSSTKATP